MKNWSVNLPIALFVIAVLFVFVNPAFHDKAPQQDSVQLDVRFITTPQNVVDQMLELAEVKASDVLYDLGCGDGRIVITAAKRYGCRGVGVDIDPKRIEESRANAKAQGVDHLIEFVEAGIFDIDLSEADVVAMYLLPELNVRLIPQFKTMKPGSRIVSHNFNMEGVTPDRDLVVKHERNPDDPYEIYGEEDELDSSVIYLWSIPLQMQAER